MATCTRRCGSTVFSPEDIGVVRAGPADRRRFLDETPGRGRPEGGAGGRGGRRRSCASGRRCCAQPAGRSTPRRPSHWTSGTRGWTRPVPLWSRPGSSWSAELAPLATEHYARLAGGDHRVGMTTVARGRARCSTPWPLPGTRTSNAVISTVGPHRDELELTARRAARRGPTRPRASSARWRWPSSLAAHQLATERLGSAPVLLLDDVFSELDPRRSRALLARPPAGPGPADHRPAGACRRWRRPRSTPWPREAMWWPRGDRREPRAAPHAGTRSPGPSTGPSTRVSRRLGLEGAAGIGRLFAGWPEIVGGGHGRTRPAGSDRPSALVVAVDHPAWATQVRRLGDTLLDRVASRPGVRATRAPGGPGPALSGPSRADHRPGEHRAATLGIGIGRRSEGPDVRRARPGIRRDAGSHPLEHCERARLWR